MGLSLLVPLMVACGSDNTGPTTTPDSIVLTSGILKSLDSTAQVMEQANSTNPDLKALVDSTLLVLSAGVRAKRLDVSTDLTTAPLYFVGVHRALGQSSGSSFSTWTLVGFDDPTHLTTLIEVGGFAGSQTAAAPNSVSGTIGDGSGIVNALFLHVASGGSVTEWTVGSGSASFVSDSPGSTCPGFTPTARVTCALETMHVHFTANASSGSGGATARQAAVPTDVDVPGMRLNFTP
jgi:hypothetical protein